MKTKNITREKISALADSELCEDEVDVALAALQTAPARDAWDAYHHIGDALRSDDMAFAMSDDFTARLMRRLEQEPTVIGRPADTVPATAEIGASAPVWRTKRFIQGTMAAAAVAAMAFVATPQMMTATKGSSAIATSAGTTTAGGAIINASADAAAPGNVLRDPGIDEYLLAHQRFSPSVYSTTQYARSAAFAVGTDK